MTKILHDRRSRRSRQIPSLNLYLNRRLLPENMKPRVTDTAHLSSVPSERCGEVILTISLLNIEYFVLLIDTNYLSKMFANLKCLREGSFQITINNLRLHLPLCNKGVIYGCIERSFMTLYDFKERPLMNVPPRVECSSSSLFNDFSYAPQYHSLSHNNVCWLQYSLPI